MYRNAVSGLLFALLSSAQPAAEAPLKAPVPPKASPAVNEALRKRVSEFYQHHVAGTTRKAMTLVAEESQDAFFNQAKSRVRSFEINEVGWGKGLQEARVVTLCEREVMVPPNGVQVMKIPVESWWKLVDGNWYWFVPTVTGCKETPFGCVSQAPSTGSPSLTADELKAKVQQSIAAARNMEDFGFQNRRVELIAGQKEQVELKFVNPLDGWITLELLNPFSDDEVEIVTPAPIRVKPQGETIVTLRLKKKGVVAKARDVNVQFVIQPFFRQSPVVIALKPKS